MSSNIIKQFRKEAKNSTKKVDNKIFQYRKDDIRIELAYWCKLFHALGVTRNPDRLLKKHVRSRRRLEVSHN